MTNKNILNLRIGENRYLYVKSVDYIQISKDGRDSTKVIINAVDEDTNNEFSISDILIDTITPSVIKGLWLVLQNNNTEIQPHSSLATMLKSYQAKNLQEMVGKTVRVVADKKGFLVIALNT